MPSPVPCTAFSPDGYEVAWSTWDGGHAETLSLTWDNEAWTAVGRVGRERVEYVLRLAPTWHVRQFLLFRDLDDPDLWLAIDADHRWGEVNGSYRTELDGCADVDLACTPFTATIPIRRLELAVGEAPSSTSSTSMSRRWQPTVSRVRYERWRPRRTGVRRSTSGDAGEFEVDEFGLVVDETRPLPSDRQRDRRRRQAPDAGARLVEPGDEAAELVAELGPAHRDRDRRFEIADRRARSKRSISLSTPWNGDRAAWARSASVSWISPTAAGLEHGDLVEHSGVST